jgi:surfeit locus 1 family protein
VPTPPVSAFDNQTTIARRRVRPRALPTLAALGAVVLFASAAYWQFGRMVQKQALRFALDAANKSSPVALPNGIADWTAWRYRPVLVTGVFDSAQQILIDNKIQNGQVGYHVVTPLQLTDARIVLVDRGFVPGGADRRALPQVPPPAGEVTVRGRVALVSEQYLELKRSPPVGPLWQNLDPKRFAAISGIPVLPIVIEQTAPLDAKDTLVRDWPPPDLGVEKHLSYAVQWLTFAALAIGFWFYFNLRRARRQSDE